MSMPMTVITVQQVAVPPTRRHVRIPGSDRATQTWWEMQGDPSTSVRLMILEEIKNHGLVDRVNRIYAQAQPASVPTAMPGRPTAVPNPPAQSAAPAAAGPSTLPFPSAPHAAVPGQAAPLADPRDIEIDALRAEIQLLMGLVTSPPLFNVA